MLSDCPSGRATAHYLAMYTESESAERTPARTRELIGSPQRAMADQLIRAIDRRHGTEPIRLHEPFNLYLMDRQAEEYLGLMSYSPYRDSFHVIIRELIASNARRLLGGLRSPMAVVDLGPGYPDKTFPVLHQARTERRACRYVPADINRKFLAVAAEACAPFAFPIDPLHCLFEELPSVLCAGPDDASRLFLMGVTFMNYAPPSAVCLISKLARHTDRVMLATELRARADDEKLARSYQSDRARRFNAMPLELAGVDTRALEYFARFRNGRVEMGFFPRTPLTVSGRSIAAGEEILTSVSYRYSVDQLFDLLSAHFSNVQVIPDRTGSSAIAIVDGPDPVAPFQSRSRIPQ